VTEHDASGAKPVGAPGEDRPRYRAEIPLAASEIVALEAALVAYGESFVVRPSPWALAGRVEGCRIGALQIRHQSTKPWCEIRLNPYTRLGTTPLWGRGDAR
jgi:hypothetical protein